MHIALRSMRVQGADGKMRNVKPGDPVPEAAGWKNVKAYENRNWLIRDSAALDDHNSSKAIGVAVADRDETIKRLTEELEAEKLKNSDEAPDETKLESSSDTEVDESEPEASPDVEAEPSDEAPAEPAVDTEAPKLSKSELDAMSKPSLQVIASDLSINPDQSKAKLAKAILEAQ